MADICQYSALNCFLKDQLMCRGACEYLIGESGEYSCSLNSHGTSDQEKNSLKPDCGRRVSSSTWWKDETFPKILTNSLMFSWPWSLLLCFCVIFTLLAYYVQILDICSSQQPLCSTLQMCWPGFSGPSESTVSAWRPLWLLSLNDYLQFQGASFKDSF